MQTKLKKMVHDTLAALPETRNSDVMLTVEIWKRYYPEMLEDNATSVSFKNLARLPREDHVKRHRAKIQNEKHLFLPTNWIVAKQRKINEERWREAMSVNHL